MAAKPILFEDILHVTEVDPDGKRFDKVSRLRCRGEHTDAECTLDVNVDIFPLKAADKVAFALSSTLSEDGKPDDGTFEQSQRKSLLDKFEYVMYGKVYKVTEDRQAAPPKIDVFASFGGLLMLLKGEPTTLKDLEVDKRIYVLIRRV